MRSGKVFTHEPAILRRVNEELSIRSCVPQDFSAIADIYNHYVRNSIATFALDTVTPGEVAAQNSCEGSWMVLVRGKKIRGYALAKAFKERGGYRHSLECGIYLHPNEQGLGYGRALYGALLADERVKAAHCLIAAISLPNPASVGLHESLGFSKVGHLAQVGRKFGRWIDVGYWQKLQAEGGSSTSSCRDQ